MLHIILYLLFLYRLQHLLSDCALCSFCSVLIIFFTSLSFFSSGDKTGSLSDADIDRIGDLFQQKNEPVVRAVHALCSAKPVSYATDRGHHQEDFKERLIQRYHCRSSDDPNVTRCMILNRYFRKSNVIASHIIGLEERNMCGMLGVDDVWDERNGILIHRCIVKYFRNMNLVCSSQTTIAFLLNANNNVLLFISWQTFLPCTDHNIRLQVLYDRLLDTSKGMSKKTLGIPGAGQATFKDLNNRPLVFPPLTFPFRRGLVRHAESAYDLALKARAAHKVAEASQPRDWTELFTYSTEQSTQCSDFAFFND